MSEFRDALGYIVYDREPGSAESCTNLTSGRQFLAEIDEIQDIELNTDLGRDARESVLIYTSDKVAAAELTVNTQIAITMFGVSSTFKVLRRKGNPANPQIEFGLMKITTKDK